MFQWIVFHAIHEGSYSKPIYQIMPRILLRLLTLYIKGYKGSMASWHDLGLWFNELLTARNFFNNTAKTRIHELTDTCRNAKSKIALLYQLA